MNFDFYPFLLTVFLNVHKKQMNSNNEYIQTLLSLTQSQKESWSKMRAQENKDMESFQVEKTKNWKTLIKQKQEEINKLNKDMSNIKNQQKTFLEQSNIEIHQLQHILQKQKSDYEKLIQEKDTQLVALRATYNTLNLREKKQSTYLLKSKTLYEQQTSEKIEKLKESLDKSNQKVLAVRNKMKKNNQISQEKIHELKSQIEQNHEEEKELYHQVQNLQNSIYILQNQIPNLKDYYNFSKRQLLILQRENSEMQKNYNDLNKNLN